MQSQLHRRKVCSYITFELSVRYFSKSQGTMTKFGQSCRAIKPGIAARTPN